MLEQHACQAPGIWPLLMNAKPQSGTAGEGEVENSC